MIESNLSEKPTAASAFIVNVDVVVFSTDRFLYKGLFHDLSIDDDGISVFTKSDFRGDCESSQGDPEPLFHHADEGRLHFGATIPRDLYTFRGRDLEMVEHGADETTVPEEGLGGEIVDAERIAELDIGDGLVERKISGKEGDENIASRPVLNV